MDKREMAKRVRNWWSLQVGAVTLTDEIAEAAAAALEREAEREEKEKKNVTLEEQEEAIRRYLSQQAHFHEGDRCGHDAWGNCDHAAAAAETLRKLRVDGARVLTAHSDSIECAAEQLLRALGVEPLK